MWQCTFKNRQPAKQQYKMQHLNYIMRNDTGEWNQGNAPFYTLILSKVNSYEDSITGKFKSPFLSFRAGWLQFLSLLAKHKGLFFNMNYGFFWASMTIYQRTWVVHGVLQDKEEKPGLLSKHVWLNIYINNNYNNIFVNAPVNYAIHHNFNFRLQVKTPPGKPYSRSWDNLTNFQTFIKESLSFVKIRSLWSENFCYHE